MQSFDIPQPPAPSPNATYSYNDWDLLLRWHTAKQAHERAADHAAQQDRLILANEVLAKANEAFAKSQDNLAAAMREATAADQASLGLSPQDKLFELIVALAYSGVDSACLLPRAQAALAAYQSAAVVPAPAPLPSDASTLR